MKRSEMLELLSGLISESRSCVRTISDEDLARMILESIEEKGMLPPKTKIQKSWPKRADEVGDVIFFEDANVWDQEG